MEKITPDAYRSSSPPERVIGVEVEHVVQNIDKNGKEVSPSSYIGPSALRAAGHQHIGYFLDNGAKLYPDVGNLEYSTAECLGPRRAAQADLDGSRVLREIVDASGENHNGVYRIAGTSLATTSARSYTSGTHENYMFAKSLIDDPLLPRLLATHLASRIWAMNGSVSKDGYQFSQKVDGMGGSPVTFAYNRMTNEGAKPMAMILGKNPDTVGNGPWIRTEVRYADPLHSPIARETSLAAGSLVHYMIEQQDILRKTGVGFDDVLLKNPTQAAHAFAKDTSLGAHAETISGKEVAALDVEEMLALRAIALCAVVDMPDGYDKQARRWLKIVDAMRATDFDRADYDSYALRTLDVAVKHRLVGGTDGIAENTKKAQALSLGWDRVVPEGSASRYWRKVQPKQYARIDASREAPYETRADVRGEFVTKFSEFVESTPSFKSALQLNWAGVKLGDTAFSDPFGA